MLSTFSWGDSGWLDELVYGLFVTSELAVLSYAIGLFLGLLGLAGKLSRLRGLRFIVSIYTTVFRGLPELLVISFIYFGGGFILQFALRPFGHTGFIEVNAFASGVASLTLITAAYATEVFHGAVLSVSKGQADAANSLGMGIYQTFFYIIFPQAWRYALPGLTNLWMCILKNTALVSVIGLVDLVQASHLASRSTGLTFSFYFAVVIGYLLLTSISMVAIEQVEKYAYHGQTTIVRV